MHYEVILMYQTHENGQKPNRVADSTPGGALSDHFLSSNHSKRLLQALSPSLPARYQGTLAKYAL